MKYFGGSTMSFMIAFGVISIMLGFGMLIRSKIPFMRKMLVPTSVIAGILGFLFMNSGFLANTDTSIFNTIVQHLFTISFISIGLTSNPTSGDTSNKTLARGSLALGMVWNLIYAVIAVIGAVLLYFVGGFFDMNPVYGLLIPFGFAQGPGQASTFGAIFEQYGWADASTVGVTFSAIGFLLAFVVGVPLAKYGLKKGLSRNNNAIKEYVERGYYKKDETKNNIGQETTFSGNIDTMTFHFMIIGISYIITLLLAEVIYYIPAVGPTIASMLFMIGLLVAYVVKYMMTKLNIDYLIDNTFQSKITGWATDYLIVASFMAVQLSVIGEWIVPIVFVSIVVALFIFFISVYFGKRIGGNNDFERTLGLFGTTTGTVPSGIALIRIVDPTFNTTTAAELGMMNIPMIFSLITLSTILAMAEGTLSFGLGLILLLLPIPFYLLILKMVKVWNKPSYSLKENN